MLNTQAMEAVMDGNSIKGHMFSVLYGIKDNNKCRCLY